VACLKNVNVVGLLGVCCNGEPLYAVLEYTKHGDLQQFLQARVAAESSFGRSLSTSSHRKTLRCRCVSPSCAVYRLGSRNITGQKSRRPTLRVVSDIAIFVLKRDVKLQLTNYSAGP